MTSQSPESSTVLLLKTQPNEKSTDEYEQILLENGFKVKLVKTLVFQYQNIELLAQKLNCSDLYSGIIFSSPRCVQAVDLACQNPGANIASWKCKKNFAVGTATYKVALEKLGIECEGQEAGNSENLLKYILKEHSKNNLPFLYPHGNLKRDTFSDSNKKNEISLDSVLTYDSLSNPNVLQELKTATNNLTQIPEYVIFFSPSGVHSTLDHLKKIENFSSAKLIPIGHTTESSMKKANLPVFRVAEKPSPEGILEIILKDSSSS